MQDDNNKPVAYDTEGRPLYLHPQQTNPPTSPPQNIVTHDGMQVVQVTRSTDPVAVKVSEETMQRHMESKKKYPILNLSDGEYVVANIDRHPIGIFAIWGITSLIIALIVGCWSLLLIHPNIERNIIPPSSVPMVSAVALALVVLALAIGWIAIVIFKGNKFFLTNESVIQNIQASLLSQKEQTINLENIKDASFTQKGFIQNIFGYGSIKLSTEGSNEEYFFTLVSNPHHQIAIINNVVEAVQYGRPIDEAIAKARAATS